MRILFHRGLIVPIVVLLSQAATGADVRHTEIPETFRGAWAVSQEDCGDSNKSDSSRSVIVISGTSYAASEAKCAVMWVTETATRQGPLFSAHLQCSAANSSAKSASNFLLLSKSADEILGGTEFSNL